MLFAKLLPREEQYFTLFAQMTSYINDAARTLVEMLSHGDGDYREYVQRINNSWAPAWEATSREQFSSDGKVLLNAEKKNRAAMSMMQASHNAPAEYSRIKSPALAFFSVGYKRFFDLAATLPDPERKNAETFLNAAKKYQEKEIEYFRKEIPNGRVVVFTNADHHCFIDKEAEVIDEMRAFLSPNRPAE